MADIRGILFDKDGTLVDFQKTWFAIGDQLALQAAHGDRAGADRLLAEAGYDFAASCFRADSVFAAGTNADVVALWYPAASGAERRTLLAGFDVFTADQVASRSVALPGSREAIASLHGAGFRLGVATNDSTRGAERTLLALGVAQMFDAVYGYDAVASPKPAPDIILAFCDLTGLAPLYPLESDFYSQMGIAPLPRSDLVVLKTRLYDEYKIEVPLVEWQDRHFVRISIQGYNTQADVDALLDALKVLLPQVACN